MRADYESSLHETGRLRDVMRRAPALRAVIRVEPGQIVIDFSDGRMHRIPHAHYIAADQLLRAAAQWCRRHGADTVEIGA
jgi:hypothetical protein